MKMGHFLIVALVVMLSGCGTKQFTPQEYPLREGLVPTLHVNGEVKVNNVQASADQAIVYSYSGSKLATNYKEISQSMVDQTIKEIKKNGQFNDSGKQKTIDLKVTYLRSTYVTMGFHWKSELKYTAVLGDGTTIEKTVHHASGSVDQDLNGCIAEAVLNLLTDQKVANYLAE